MDHEGRIERLGAKLADAGLDALLVTNLTNVRYLTGFSGTNGQVLVTASEATFFTDPRYEARSGDLVTGAEVVVYQARLTDVLPEALSRAKVSRLGFEASTLTVASRDDLASKLSVELIGAKDLVEGLRRVKEDAEVGMIREAVALGDRAFAWIADRLAPGIPEREVALDLEVFMRQGGADEVSFTPIVGSGPLSAHIHHTASERVFEKGDLVLLDFGSRVDGYCSDLTRTVVLGPATDEQRQTYELVLLAQRRGIEAVRAGALAVEVDKAGRAVVEDAGHGQGFGHGLGHGVGLDIHEAPKLHYISEDTLLAGDVVTVEPGIYRVGWGGIRIEDCVLVTDEGAEVLGTAPKDDLLEL